MTTHTPAEWKKKFDSAAFEEAYHCTSPLGAYLDEGGTHFALWAPTAEKVVLRLYHSGHEGDAYRIIPMENRGRGLWQHDVRGSMHGIYYDYAVTVDGVERITADPWAKACGLNGARSMAVNLRATDPEGWRADRAPAPAAENIIYEIHVKDFSWDPASGVPEEFRGKYAALTLTGTTLDHQGVYPTCVDHVRHLGATHVQLMPVYDYGSVDEGGDPDAFNWGYDPVNYNVPEGSYATDPARGEVRIRELKQAVMALHRAGLRVIMDVVYNHTYHLDSWLFRTVPWYFYRQKEDGSASNGSGCGTEIASERSMAARYILDSVMYWAEEYHIDGFRFDLMGMLDTDLMNRIREALDKKYGKGEKLVFGEPWAGGACHPRAGVQLSHKDNLKRLDNGVGAFCDNTRDAVKGSVMQAESRGFVNGGGIDAQKLAGCIRGWAGPDEPFRTPNQTITYVSSHDDWTLFDKLVYSMDAARDFTARKPEILRANHLAAALYCCCQGHLFLLSGEEFARTKLGVRDSYASPVALNRLDWNRAFEMRSLTEYYRGLFALRQQLPALCDKSADAPSRLLALRQTRPDTAAVLLRNGGKSPYREVLLLFSARKEKADFVLPRGKWAVLADGSDSFLWRSPAIADISVTLPPVSAMILGRIQ